MAAGHFRYSLDHVKSRIVPGRERYIIEVSTSIFFYFLDIRLLAYNNGLTHHTLAVLTGSWYVG